MKPLSFHPEIAIDIKGSYNWYEKQLEGLGKEFLYELENGFEAIQNFPNAWANYQYDFKRYILNKFPFSIIYKISNEGICMIVVMHNSINPSYAADRII